MFPGGAFALQRFLNHHKQPLTTSAPGTVFVEFTVNFDGSVSNLVVLEGLGIEADQEAVRIVSEMPQWIPGTVNGEPARFKFVLPVDFAA
jgi:protein TonB